ncbi:hypothetical protein ACGYLR_06985 [Leuconostoc lactis]|uniref:hypothetical protein n=1 Tax=Leuconostoc lactis TaxID=1246 RepID=UPI003746544D
MKYLGLEVGSWADWVGALATFLATGLALYLSLKRPNYIKFEIKHAQMFFGNYENLNNRVKDLTNNFSELRNKEISLRQYFTKYSTIYDLSVYIANTAPVPLMIREMGVIVPFHKKIIVYSNIMTKIEANGGNINRPLRSENSSSCMSIPSFVLNPFLGRKRALIKFYIVNGSGETKKSRYFNISA